MSLQEELVGTRQSDANSTLPPVLREQRRLRFRTMKLSYLEGGFAMVMLALVEAFYIPYLDAMGATSLQIGLGASLPALVSGMVQLYTPLALYRTGSRKQ